MTSGDERRKSQRHREMLEIAYSFMSESPGVPSLFDETQTLDISRRGVKVHLTKPVALETLVQMAIRLPALRSPILMVGKVRWTEEDATGHRVGIKFIGHLPPKLEQAIDTLAS
ncbi:PilZ domain-containing protein [Candidatus Sumerlaeota bacterium]|nr:PilZ domain-containing protein [Candidatus Sumerlaeota bacterium]